MTASGDLLPRWLDELTFDGSEDDVKCIIDRLFRYSDKSDKIPGSIMFITCFLKCDRFLQSNLYDQYCQVFDREKRIYLIMNAGRMTNCPKYQPVITENTIFAKTLEECYSEILDKYPDLKTKVNVVSKHLDCPYYSCLQLSLQSSLPISRENVGNKDEKIDKSNKDGELNIDLSDEYRDFLFYRTCRHFVSNYGTIDRETLSREVNEDFFERYVNLEFLRYAWQELPIILDLGTLKTRSILDNLIERGDDLSEEELLKRLFKMFKLNCFPWDNVKEINEMFVIKFIPWLRSQSRKHYHLYQIFYAYSRASIKYVPDALETIGYRRSETTEPELVQFIKAYSSIPHKTYDKELFEIISRFNVATSTCS